MKINIITPKRTAFTSKADKIFGPGHYGEFGLLPDHASFVTLNKPGVITVHLGADEIKMLVGKGFAEASDDEISYLVEICEKVEDIDKKAAQEALDKAQKSIDGLDPLDAQYNTLMDQINLANARLEA